MIYDCFMFFNELDLLEIRMEELWDIVDKFVMTEATTTHRGQPKRMYYQENKDRFKKYQSKIINLEVDLRIGRKESDVRFFAAEREQRNFFQKNMEFQDDDIFILSDVDEIPNVDILKKYDIPEEIKKHKRIYMTQTLHCYYVDYVSNQRWIGPFITTGFQMKQEKLSGLRRKIQHGSRRALILEDSGWHFSYLGGPNNVIDKINNIAHKEDINQCLDTTYDNVVSRINNGQSLFKGGATYKLDKTLKLPKYLVKNRKKFSYMFYEGELK